MKVFITGATGYIGSEVAQAFRRAGHEVRGLILHDTDAARLKKDEIIPVVGDLRDPASYSEPETYYLAWKAWRVEGEVSHARA